MEVIFLGTPQFAVPTLEGIAAAGHRVIAVYTQPDRPKGRGRETALSSVKESAIRLGLTVRQPERVRRPEIVEEFGVGIFFRRERECLRVHVAKGDDFVALRRTFEIGLAFSTAADRGDAALAARGSALLSEEEIGKNDAAGSGGGEAAEEGAAGGLEATSRHGL